MGTSLKPDSCIIGMTDEKVKLMNSSHKIVRTNGPHGSGFIVHLLSALPFMHKGFARAPEPLLTLALLFSLQFSRGRPCGGDGSGHYSFIYFGGWDLSVWMVSRFCWCMS
eukprot:1136670-Pelagomonas_calceolata.AAC.1